MNYGKRMWLSIFWIMLGAILNIFTLAGVADEYWGAMGIALIGVGIVRLLQHIRYRSDEKYREKVDVANNDERNRYLSLKAWAWAGYGFVLLGGLGTIVFRLLDREDLSVFCATSVCVLMILYWISHFCLRKKY